MWDQSESASLWELFRATGEPLAYVLYRCAAGECENNS